MPISDAKLAANRRNAQLSTGPKSDDGKRRAANNAIKHGIYAKTSVLFNENQEEYDAHLQDFLDRFQPQDRVETHLVHRMADCEWRLTRIRYIETAALDLQLDETSELAAQRYQSIDESTRMAFAVNLLDRSQSSAYTNLSRTEAALHRQYERAYKLLLDIRKSSKLKSSESNNKKSWDNEPNSEIAPEK